MIFHCTYEHEIYKLIEQVYSAIKMERKNNNYVFNI